MYNRTVNKTFDNSMSQLLNYCLVDFGMVWDVLVMVIPLVMSWLFTNSWEMPAFGWQKTELPELHERKSSQMATGSLP